MNIITATIFLSQITIGILGNFLLLFHYVILRFCECRSRATDMLLRHLPVANSLAILCKAVPYTILALGLTHHLNDVGCKLFLYFERVARGVTIFITCLLSVFQVITISPLHSRWAGLKLKAIKYVGPSSILCWILHLLVNAIFPIYASGKWTNSTIVKKNMPKYCSSKNNDNITFSLYVALISSHDVLCLGFMSWASGSMVFILYRHKQRVQHIYNNNMTPRSSAETRATKSILVLVVTYVLFYAVSSIIYAYLACFVLSTWWFMSIAAFISMCFPTISPFLLLSSDPRVSRLHTVRFC